MRVLVYPHDLELGGSSINAVDLAAAVRAHGHETLVIARPGPLADHVRARGLDLVTMEVPTRPRPWPGAVRAIRDTARRFGADVVHTYEFWPSIEAQLAVGGRGRAAVVSTIMTMGLAYYLPRTVPMTLGYRDLLDEAERWQRAPVYLLEPPIDTATDRPEALPPGAAGAFVEEHGLHGDLLDIVIVSRVATHMKQEGIERTVDAVERLGRTLPVRLIIVGGGSAFDAVQRRADGVNERLGRRAVVLTGPKADPRPAYQFADIVVGMGSSALRGLAFAKPVVVVGVNGFSRTVQPETLQHFEAAGFYGVGNERPDPARDPLVGQLRALVTDPDARERLGEFGRDLVRDRFSLESGARTLDDVYRTAVSCRPGAARRWADTASTLRRTAVYKARDGGVLRRLRPALARLPRIYRRSPAWE